MKKKLLQSISILVILSLFLVSGCKKDVPVTGVKLNKNNLTLTIGATETLIATVLPDDATNQAISWASSNTTIASVENGVVTAKVAGSATITVTTKEGNYTATCVVIVTPTEPESEWVEINGVKWAKYNVDKPGTFAAHSEDAGMYYQWNTKVGWSSTDPMINSDGGTTWNTAMPTGDSWEKANDPCPIGWRVPTHDEQASLVNSGSKWATVNGVNGRYFGSDEKNVFFPAAGYRTLSDGTFGAVSFDGFYWSNMPYESDHAYILRFASGGAYTFDDYRSYAFSVRCVLE